MPCASPRPSSLHIYNNFLFLFFFSLPSKDTHTTTRFQAALVSCPSFVSCCFFFFMSPFLFSSFVFFEFLSSSCLPTYLLLSYSSILFAFLISSIQLTGGSPALFTFTYRPFSILRLFNKIAVPSGTDRCLDRVSLSGFPYLFV